MNGSEILNGAKDYTSALNYAKCGIFTKSLDGILTKCGKLSFTPINNEHIRQVKRKNYPFFVEDEATVPVMICQMHQKFILNAPKFNDQTYKLNLTPYQFEERKEMQEFTDALLLSSENEQSELAIEALREKAFDQLFSNSYENTHERFRDYENYESTSTLVPPMNDRQEETGNGAKCNAKFDELSAATLRRIKKHFKWPNRSGVSSKSQILDGVVENVQSLPIEPTETIANFLYTVYKKQNVLDYPNGIE